MFSFICHTDTGNGCCVLLEAGRHRMGNFAMQWLLTMCCCCGLLSSVDYCLVVFNIALSKVDCIVTFKPCINFDGDY